MFERSFAEAEIDLGEIFEEFQSQCVLLDIISVVEDLVYQLLGVIDVIIQDLL